MKVWAEDRSLCVSEIEREEKVKGGILHAIIVLVMSNFLKTLIFPQLAEHVILAEPMLPVGFGSDRKTLGRLHSVSKFLNVIINN